MDRRHVSGVFARGEYSAMIKSKLDDYYSATCAARYRGGPFHRDGKYKLAHGSVAFAFTLVGTSLTGSLEPFNSIPSSHVNWDTLWKLWACGIGEQIRVIITRINRFRVWNFEFCYQVVNKQMNTCSECSIV